MTRSRHGFTLVELLVVIGIIAVLISILLPSLARARQSALTLQCLSNVRTIGQSLMMYANDNKGYYPYGWTFITDTGSGDQRYLPQTLVSYMGNLSYNPWDSAVNSKMQYWQCPEVTPSFAFPWTPASHYGFHIIVFPVDFWTSPMINGGRTKIPLYKGVWMSRNGADKAILWDGTIDTDMTGASSWGGSAFPGSCHVDSDRFWWGSYLLDAPSIWPSWHNPNEQIGLNGVFQDRPANKADGSDAQTFRTRHNGNTACNFLFGDGHAETRRFTRNGISRDQGTSDMTHLNFSVPVSHPAIGP